MTMLHSQNQKTPDTPKCIGNRIADESTIYCATSVAARLFNFDKLRQLFEFLVQSAVILCRYSIIFKLILLVRIVDSIILVSRWEVVLDFNLLDWLYKYISFNEQII